MLERQKKLNWKPTSIHSLIEEMIEAEYQYLDATKQNSKIFVAGHTGMYLAHQLYDI